MKNTFDSGSLHFIEQDPVRRRLSVVLILIFSLRSKNLVRNKVRRYNVVKGVEYRKSNSYFTNQPKYSIVIFSSSTLVTYLYCVLIRSSQWNYVQFND